MLVFLSSNKKGHLHAACTLAALLSQGFKIELHCGSWVKLGSFV